MTHNRRGRRERRENPEGLKALALLGSVHSGLGHTDLGQLLFRSQLRFYRRWSREVGFGRRADRLEPPADIDLGMRFSTEMAGARGTRGGRVPLEYRELGIAALNDKPVIWAVSDPATDFASEFLESCHTLARVS